MMSLSTTESADVVMIYTHSKKLHLLPSGGYQTVGEYFEMSRPGNPYCSEVQSFPKVVNIPDTLQFFSAAASKPTLPYPV
jgi:hypothetical protein